VTTRTILRLVILAGAVAYFAYAHFKGHGADEAKPTLAAPIAANAKQFTLGTLDFKACEIKQKNSGATTTAFCAPFSVPENREDSNSRKIDLRLALIKSDAAAADADIVVFLAGGPGQAAVDTWPMVAGSFAPLRKHHHILLLDQRGTGQSNPLTCKHADENDTGEEFDAAKAEQRIRTCLDEVAKKADPRLYTTTIAADDLEAVRAALGNPLFNLVGISYGTRMAQQYAMRHPQGVRSIVLDSVAPNEIALGQDFAANLERALKAQFAACTETPACQKAFGDSYANLYALRDQLRTSPREFDYHNPTTFKADKKRLNQYALTGLVRMFAYTPETAALLPLSISQGLHGDFTPLLGQTELIQGDLADLTDNGMQMSVICSEDADLIAPRPEDDTKLLGNLMIKSLQAMCSVWPHGTRPADFHAAYKSDKPVLVLEGELDPVTPPSYGEQVMKNLSNAKLVVAKGQGHNVIGRGCIPKVVEDFVDNLKPKDLDVKCVDMLGATPAFIDFNGSAP
jgi:pimeloyl-ACP methyl ester carboxylesterase